mgnify:CR=1 FL=1
MVSADLYCVADDGSIVGEDDRGVVESCHARGIEVYACVSNYNDDSDVEDFDAARAHAAIGVHRETTLGALVALARSGGYDGVNVDFEDLAYSGDIAVDRTAFASFIHELAERLHAQGLKLVVSVPGKTEDSLDDDWSFPFDYASLGGDADILQLMTYDQHGPWSEPGPVSGADWVEDCVAYAASVVDPGKLLMGLPAYGYDWDLTASRPARGEYLAEAGPWVDVPTLLARFGTSGQWDPASSSPFLTYRGKEGPRHVVWYEDAASLRAKTKLVLEYGLGGLSVWRLGTEDRAFWDAVTTN